MIDPIALQAIKSHANLLAAGSHQAIPPADLETILRSIPSLVAEIDRMKAEAIVVEVDPDPVLVTSTTSIPPRDLKRR